VLKYVFALLVIAGLVGLSGGVPSEVEAAQTSVDVLLTGAEENPPVTNQPTIGGLARFVFDDVTNELSFFVTVTGVSPDEITAAHIHRGARGVNGPIIHFLSATGFTQVSGRIQLSAADVADLRAGNLYANIHSKTNPGGVARGQIVLPAAPARPAAAASPAVAPPRTGDGGLADTSSSTSWMLAGLVALGATAAGAAIVRRRA
jgi:hypothetical protein